MIKRHVFFLCVSRKILQLKKKHTYISKNKGYFSVGKGEESFYFLWKFLGL